jgi:hypothetical protein
MTELIINSIKKNGFISVISEKRWENLERPMGKKNKKSKGNFE